LERFWGSLLDYETGGLVLAEKVPLHDVNGFTLVELMITIAILAILVTLALPMAGDWLKNAQIRTAAESMLDGLEKARNEAVRRNAPVAFALVGGGSAWQVETAVNGAVVETRAAGEGSSQVVVTTWPKGTNTVTFDGMGRRWGDPATGKNLDAVKSDQMTHICLDLPASILDKTKTRNLELDISLMGAVRMCDPQVSDTTDARYCPGYPTDCTD
jgi:type IV fimbrial biogenesis protein FimT